MHRCVFVFVRACVLVCGTGELSTRFKEPQHAETKSSSTATACLVSTAMHTTRKPTLQAFTAVQRSQPSMWYSIIHSNKQKAKAAQSHL